MRVKRMYLCVLIFVLHSLGTVIADWAMPCKGSRASSFLSYCGFVTDRRLLSQTRHPHLGGVQPVEDAGEGLRPQPAIRATARSMYL